MYMNIIKQHVVLNLLRSGRYSVNEQGEVVSNIGRETRILKPIKLYTGYLEYRLDVGFNEAIMVYGQGIVYLATYLQTFDPTRVIDHKDGNKANNKPDNLRCITTQENNRHNFHGPNGTRQSIRKRLAPDEIAAILNGHEMGISNVKLAQRYSVTRQTIAAVLHKNSVK
jgi:hypothetical protein